MMLLKYREMVLHNHRPKKSFYRYTEQHYIKYSPTSMGFIFHQVTESVHAHSPISCSCSFFFSGFSPSLSLSLLKRRHVKNMNIQLRPLECWLTVSKSSTILVIALCLLDRLLALFVFILQVIFKFLCSVQVLHTLCSYALLCFVAVGFI